MIGYSELQYALTAIFFMSVPAAVLFLIVGVAVCDDMPARPASLWVWNSFGVSAFVALACLIGKASAFLFIVVTG